MTVDIYDRLEARKAVDNFLGRPVRVGEVIELKLTGRYTIDKGRIVRIEISPRAG